VKPPSPLPGGRRLAPGTWSLRSRLVLLVIVTMAPLLALGLVVQYTEYENDKKVASERTLELARGVALQVGRELEADLRALQVLAKAGRIRRGAIEQFRELADAALTDRLAGASILVLDPQGQPLLNTALPPGTPLPAGPGHDSTRQVFATGQPLVSNVFRASAARGPMVWIEAPVKDDAGRVLYSLALDPRPDTFVDILRRQGSRKGVIIALLDRDGTIIARWPESSRYTGQKAPPSLLARLRTDAETTFEATTFDGSEVLTAISRVEPSGWTVAIGTPHDEYLGPLWHSVALIVAGTAFALAIGLGLARWVTGQITRPITALVAYADDTRGTVTGSGGALPDSTGLRETDALGAAIRRYVGARERAERDLVALNRTLEQRIAGAVAERNEAQARLAEAQKMEAVGQLTGGIAHDFNNLLTAIIGSLDLVRKETAGNARLQTLSGLALQSAQRGALLVSQLLAFGRRQTLRPQSVALAGVLEDIRLQMRPPAGGTVTLETRLAPDLWPCQVDRAQLEAAMLNLVLNAYDAMPRGGALTIAGANRTIDAAEARRLGIAPGDYAGIAVTDTGIGMTSETQARAFEPFFTTKGAGKGTGLGLSQVYGLARQSMGAATIESRAGGTTVTLLLPRAAELAAPAPASGAPVAATAVSRKRILLVEGHEEVRVLAQSLFEDLGHDTTVAPGAEAAIAVLRSEAPIDLLFCDVMLGGPVDGFKLTEYAQGIRPGLKVLLTTGYPDQVQPDKPDLEMIAKPYQQATLAAKLAALFR
jgi:signal transduction histidine kinase